MKDRQQKLFREMPVWKAIFSMAVPSMLIMVVMILYNMADMFFVGQTGDTDQVASVSLVMPMYTILMAIGSMLGGGSCILIAKHLGGKDGAAVKRCSSLTAYASLGFGILYTVLVLLLKPVLLPLLGTTSDTAGFADDYLTILSFGAPVMIFSTGMGRLTSGEGAIKEGVIANLIGTVVNIVLDPLFILAFDMGVGGAALATVLGNVTASIYLIIYILKRSPNLSLRPKDALSAPKELFTILFLGLPNAVSSILSGFANAIANNFLVPYGTRAIAAIGAAGKSTMLINMIQMGITMGVQPLLAFQYGEKNLKRLREVIRKLSLLTIGIGLVVTLLCLLNSRFVIELFLKKDPAALDLGQQFVKIMILSGPFLGIYHLCSGFLQATGAAFRATLVSMLRQGLFFIPLLFLMSTLFGMLGNVWAHLTSDILSGITALILAIIQWKKVKKLCAEQVESLV